MLPYVSTILKFSSLAGLFSLVHFAVYLTIFNDVKHDEIFDIGLRFALSLSYYRSVHFIEQTVHKSYKLKYIHAY